MYMVYFDIGMAFLNGKLKEEIYMSQLEGYEKVRRFGVQIREKYIWTEVGSTAVGCSPGIGMSLWSWSSLWK